MNESTKMVNNLFVFLVTETLREDYVAAKKENKKLWKQNQILLKKLKCINAKKRKYKVFKKSLCRKKLWNVSDA